MGGCRYIVDLAEWGARIREKGFLLEESDDNHPMAWHRIIDPETGSEADPAQTQPGRMDKLRG